MGAIAIVRFHLAGKSDSGSQALKSLGAIQDWRIAMHEKRMSWWLWPNVLSLDAPIVALVWHLAFARTYEVPVGEVEAALLGLAVWAIYVADRLLDTARANDSEETARHAFHARHRRAFLVGILVALVVAAVLAIQLERLLLIFGALMTSLSVVYGWLVHRRVVRVPKEALCGAVFSVGVLGSLFVDPVPWVSMALFAAVCTANCVVISFVEGEISESCRRWLGLVLLVLATMSVLVGGVIHLAMATSFLGLLVLHVARLPKEATRVLADVVLLTPLLAWSWL